MSDADLLDEDDVLSDDDRRERDRLISWAMSDAGKTVIELDRYLVKTEGLKAFTQLAWHTVEGGSSYRSNWHLDAIFEHLEGVSRGEIRRLAIAMPPRCMKSLSSAVMWPAWDWVASPWRRFLFASYAHNLSMRDSTRCRRVIQSPWYQLRWGDRFKLTSDQNTKIRFENDFGGYRLSTSVGGQLTGEGGDVVVCFPFDQMIATEFGDMMIGDVVERRAKIRVWSYDTKVGRVALKPIVGWHHNPGRQIVRVVLSDGASFRCTADHQIWTLRGWVRADSLELRDVLPPGLRGRSPARIEVVGYEKSTFCLTVAGYHTMLVSADGYVIARNCDDAHNVSEAESEAVREATLRWWDEAMSSRLNDPARGAFMLIQQRVHAGDLMGHVLRKQSSIPWTTLILPMEYEPDHPARWFRDPRKEAGELLWPEHVPAEIVQDLKARMGPYAAAAQLQQRPAPREGGIFKRAWFRTIKVAPVDTRWVRGWDFAATEAKILKSDPDYTASALVGWSPSMQTWIISHIERFREDPHLVEKALLDRAEADGVEVPIDIPQDPGQAGKSQVRNLTQKLSKFSVFSAPVTGDKMVRAMAWAAKAGAGMVALVEGDWNRDFLDEVTGFPTAAHDDMVDAVSGAFARLTGSSFGIADYYMRQLRDMGVDPNAIVPPHEQRAAEAAAAAEAGQQPGTGVIHRNSNDAVEIWARTFGPKRT